MNWVKVADFPAYEVSDDGRVRRNGRELSPGTDDWGYQVVQLWHDGKPTMRKVHRLVARAFHGEPTAEQIMVRHLNGNPADNRARNVRWATQAENEADKELHGTNRRGFTRKQKTAQPNG